MKSLLVHLGFLGALLLSGFTIFVTQASSPDYKKLWCMVAVLAIVQLTAAVGLGILLHLKPRLLLAAVTALTLFAVLEMTLRVWFRIRLI